MVSTFSCRNASNKVTKSGRFKHACYKHLHVLARGWSATPAEGIGRHGDVTMQKGAAAESKLVGASVSLSRQMHIRPLETRAPIGPHGVSGVLQYIGSKVSEALVSLDNDHDGCFLYGGSRDRPLRLTSRDLLQKLGGRRWGLRRSYGNGWSSA